MINSITGTKTMVLEEATSNYGVCCSMLRAGFGQELWTSMRMTYSAAAEFLEKVIHEMNPDKADTIIAEIQNEEY